MANTLAPAAVNHVMNGSAKSWVNFSGTSHAIQDSFNVSSVTDLGTGTHRVNISSAMSNANFTYSNGNKHSGDNSVPSGMGENLTTTRYGTRVTNLTNMIDANNVTLSACGDLA
jgi:hypothetical protein